MIVVRTSVSIEIESHFIVVVSLKEYCATLPSPPMISNYVNLSVPARQLQGHRKPVYVAGTTQEAVDKALKATQGTTIGVMNNRGKVVKKSTRR